MDPLDSLKKFIKGGEFFHNPSPPLLYSHAIQFERHPSVIADSGAIIAHSGEKTGRSPADKRIVRDPKSEADIWWGSVNVELAPHTFQINRERALDFLNTRERIYVVDGYAGWDLGFRVKIRVVCSRPYHALFMTNLMIRPNPQELEAFAQPDFVIYNAGEFPANKYTTYMTSNTSVDVNLDAGEMVILGTEYAGEMKRGIFTMMNYIMPKAGVISMHCAANESAEGEVSLFFGLSGTGKTTLSTDPKRRLIGDDEHGWTELGIFNIEGGCYAKCLHLSEETEAQIVHAIRFGTVLENVVYDPVTHAVDFEDSSITENTRAAYPIQFNDNAKIPCIGGHPNNIFFLSCDAFGVLPPVSKLTPAQASYYFISGYTAKVAGSEMGVGEPQATFSACYGAAFLVWSPLKYAELLAQRIQQNQTQVWLLNTGWFGGASGDGERIKVEQTRAIVDSIHSGALVQAPTLIDPCFGLSVPTTCAGVPDSLLIPGNSWHDKTAYKNQALCLANLFQNNFKKFADKCRPEVVSAGPKV